MPVRYLPVKSHPAAVTGVQARRAGPGAQAIVHGTEDAAFKTDLIANAATGRTPSKDFSKAIAGQTFTFGARASTSGRPMPAPSTTAGRSWSATSRSRRSTASRAAGSSPGWPAATRP